MWSKKAASIFSPVVLHLGSKQSAGEDVTVLPAKLDEVPGNKVRPQIAEALGLARATRSQPA